MTNIAPERGAIPSIADSTLPSFLFPTEIDLSTPLLRQLGQRLTEFLQRRTKDAQEGRLRDPFFMEQQTQSNWCWASVGVALGRFFGNPAAGQCAVVQRTRKPDGVSCCERPSSSACNVVEKMSRLLEAIGVERLATPAQPQGTLDL